MDNRLQWWRDAKFGMMVHWGVYSQLAGEWKGQRAEYLGAWIMSRFRIPMKEYEQVAKTFDIADFDANVLVKLGKDTGMKYIIFTAKHHDGFAMYDSKVDDYNVTNYTPSHRDPLRELANACKEQGVKLCLYYSQALDWHEKDAGGSHLPGNRGMSWGNGWDFPNPEEKVFARYFEKKVKPQVTELLTGYGEIPLMWFDCPATIIEEQSRELYQLVRTLQPNCIINSRIGHGVGDYRSLGDNAIPCGKLAGDWESVTTLNDTWGYKYFDHNWKDSKTIIGTLANLVSKNINYVVNVGPDGRGNIPLPSVTILGEVGKWYHQNEEAVSHIAPSPFPYDLDGCFVTKGEKALYCILRPGVSETLTVDGFIGAVEKVTLLEDGTQLSFVQELPTETTPGTLRIAIPQEMGQKVYPVIKLWFSQQPQVNGALLQQSDGTIRLPAIAADIHNVEQPLIEQDTNHAGTDAVVQKVTNHIEIAPLGCTINWLDCQNYISWTFQVYQSGTYKLQLSTSGVRHSNPWKGGHRIRVQLDGEDCLECMVVADEMEKGAYSGYYAGAITQCGDIALTAGKHTLNLLGDIILDNDHLGLNVSYLTLTPMADEKGK